MFREENRFSKSKNRISLFHKNRTSERRFGVLKFSPGPGPDSGGKKRKNDLSLFSGIQWRIFDSFSYIRTQTTFIQAEKAGGKSDVLSSRKRKNREFWNRNLLFEKSGLVHQKGWVPNRGLVFIQNLHDTPMIFPLEEHPMYWVNSAESSVFLFSKERMKNHDGLLKNAERNLSRRIVQCTRSDRSVCFWNRQRKRAHRLSTISKQDENWKCPFRRESQWKGYWLEDLEIVSNKRKGWVQSSSSISPTLVGSEKETFRKENRKRNPTFSRGYFLRRTLPMI